MSELTVYTDRSRIVCDSELCSRRRYWEYEFGGRGLALDGDNTAGRDIGSCVHVGIDYALKLMRSREAEPLLGFAVAAAHAAPEFERLQAEDDRDMVDALVRTWWAVVRPQLAAGWVVEDCEREELFVYEVPLCRYCECRCTYVHDAGECVAGPNHVGATTQELQKAMRCECGRSFGRPAPTINFMSRLDLLARATPTATLNGAPVAPGLWVWDWKCIKRAGDRWRVEQRYNMQWLTSLLGPEARLGTRMEGVIVCALLKDAHPLVSTWRNKSTGETSNRFRYTCVEPHPFRYAKGGMCMGGVQHTLGSKDWEAVPVRDLPGGQAAHFARILETEPSLLVEWVDFVGPMVRVSDYEIERWKRQHLRREVEIARVRSAEPLSDEALDRWFPQRTSACLQFARFEGAVPVGGCPAHDFCFGVAAPESYQWREFNHPGEAG